MVDPRVKVKFCLQDRSNNIDNPKVSTDIYVNKCCVFVFGQYKTSFTLNQEVNGCDVISLKIDVLVLREETRLEQWTNPCNEGRRSSFETINLLIGVLMDE